MALEFLKLEINEQTEAMTPAEMVAYAWICNWCKMHNGKCTLSRAAIFAQIPGVWSERTLIRTLQSLIKKQFLRRSGCDSRPVLSVIFSPGQYGSETQDPDTSPGQYGSETEPIRPGLRANMAQTTINKEIKKEEGERSPPGSLQNTRLAGGYGASADPGASAEREPENRPRQPDPKPKKPKHKDWL